jgi:hypothetical protein
MKVSFSHVLIGVPGLQTRQLPIHESLNIPGDYTIVIVSALFVMRRNYFASSKTLIKKERKPICINDTQDF